MLRVLGILFVAAIPIHSEASAREAEIGSGVSFPIVRGKYPKTSDTVSALPYSIVDVSQLGADYRVSVEYRGDANLKGARMFRVSFDGPKHKSALTDWIPVQGSGLPRTTGVLGSEFTVLEEIGLSTRTRIGRVMPEQPFDVIRTVTFQ